MRVYLMLFLKEKQVAALLTLKDQSVIWHLSKIAKHGNSTYVYITKLMSILEKLELVVIETKGNRRIVKLTNKGFKLANSLEEAKSILG